MVRRAFLGRAAATLATACLLGFAAPASATLVHTHEVVGSFNGAGSKSAEGSTGPFGRPYNIGIEQESGTVYVSDQGYGGVIDKFNAGGTPVPFSALGPGVNSVVASAFGVGGDTDLPVDNSGTSTQGQFYSFTPYTPIHAHAKDGTEILGPNFPLQSPGPNCGLAVDPHGNVWMAVSGEGLTEFSSGGAPLGKTIPITEYGSCHLAIDQSSSSPTSGYIYVEDSYAGTGVHVYDSTGTEKYRINQFGLSMAVDPSNSHIYIDDGQFVREYEPSTGSTPGALVSTFGEPDPAHSFGGLCGSEGVAVNELTHYVYASNCDGRVYMFGSAVEYIVPNVLTDTAEIHPTTALLRGHVDPDGGKDITDCHFDWGINSGYGEIAPCTPSTIHGTDPNTAVSAEISGLTPGTEYHYRLVASSENGKVIGADQTFKPQGPPVVSGQFASDVNSDGARILGRVDPDGAESSYHFEYGPDTGYGTSIPLTDVKTKSPTETELVATNITGLAPNTSYHFRITASNEQGTTHGADRQFTTFALYSGGSDRCANAQVRKQTGAALLLDCRAYELVSAAYTGGYDVESDLIPGQAPLVAEPQAPDRLLYSLHYGAIPGIAGNPPNLGLDPYVAERGADSWTTRYVGVAADGAPSTNAFGSPLAAADSSLSAFAFGGELLCEPCFSDGTTGIPVRLPDGALVQGMAGALNPGAGAKPAGYVGRALSADGSHLVFGSTSKFEPDGNSNGDITIYDRNLETGTTAVVSKAPNGSGTMTGPGIGELDISTNGSRILVGRKISTDAAGNTYWHLYMNTGDSGQTIDLTPSTTAGVLYDGMTADGSKAFFTTPDSLLAADTDGSSDLYEADVSGGGAALQLVSTGSGGTGNTDACTPVNANSLTHWNSVSAAASCDVLGLAGGSGVASDDGTVFFLSPERLDGNGVANAANLFIRRPGGSPQLVATLAPTDQAVRNADTNNEIHNYADFQVTPDGSDAVFSSIQSLTEFNNLGHQEIFRYDSQSNELACASCPPTEASPSTETTLSPFGLNLSDDGRVFFTSAEQLALRDTNRKKDAYEWENGVIDLISTGGSSGASGLLSVSSNGIDAFFFTRQVLSAQDDNGTSMKVYAAREEGGFFTDITPPPCQASDECHGPGTQPPAADQISTLEGVVGNSTPSVQTCRKGLVRKHGRCVKRSKKKHTNKRKNHG